MAAEAPRRSAPTRTLTTIKIPRSQSNGGDNNDVVDQEQGSANGTQTQSPQLRDDQPEQASSPVKPTSGQAGDSTSGQNQQLGTTSTQSTTLQEQYSPIDPLSEQILRRTNTEKAPSKVRSQPLAETDATATTETRHSLAHDEPSAGTRRESNAGQQKPAKDKKKGTSFLSRFMGSKKRGIASESNDDISELGENRMAGMDAEVFAQPIGFMPRYPPPPKYIKVRSHHKKRRDFNRLFVAQELRGRSEADCAPQEKPSKSNAGATGAQEKADKSIWALEFSDDGKFLAVAGQDKKVNVWAVISTPEDRQAHEIEEEARNDQPLVRLSAPVFKTQPVQVFEGHTASVVDLSWSKNNFLLSTSMDKTVRLWHITRNECLCIFKHNDFVTSIEFHPRDDRFFLAGSLDFKLRLWSIPDKTVAYVATVPDMVTAVAFTPDGKHSIAGCLNGLCLVYDTDGLKIQSQIHVRSARGKNAKGSKITGINTVMHPPDSENGIIKLLITSNDSRIRLYNFRDRTLEAKFRSNENATSQIRASFSADGRYIICGSEDRRAYIWPLTSSFKDADKRPVEFFEAHGSIVTSAVFAPTKTKQVLDSTGDLLYDLCNPPPVTLVGQAPSSTSKQPPTEAEGARNDESAHPAAAASEANTQRKQLEESPAYVARSKHPDGNIIVTADVNGSIKVFRQDCGYHRRPHDTLEESSTFPRKLLGRAGSINRRRSVASSVGKSSHHKTPSERILSWRSGVIGSHNDNPSVDNLRAGSLASLTRSTSPSKSLHQDSPARKESDTPQGSQSPVAQSTQKRESTQPATANALPVSSHPGLSEGEGDLTPQPIDRPNPLPPKGGGGFMSWGATRQRPQHQTSISRHSRQESMVSALSSDISATGEEEESEAAGEAEEDDEQLSCRRCAGTKFRATRTRQGEQRLICVQCESPAS